MKIEENNVLRDWTVSHEGRTFCVAFMNSDTHALGVCHRANWQVYEQTGNRTKELSSYRFSDRSPENAGQATEDTGLIDSLIEFCLGHWEHEVAWETTEYRETRRQGQ